jgi:hypothetical protein
MLGFFNPFIFQTIHFWNFNPLINTMNIAPIGSKHESESLFQNLAIDIAEVQTLGGIILLGGDFNARTRALPNTINTSDLCELLQALELAKIEQPNTMVKRQIRDASISS